MDKNRPVAPTPIHDLSRTERQQHSMETLHQRYMNETASNHENRPVTDAERYQWIRANRGNHMIHEALAHANFDTDFDTQIDAAMRAQRMGRHLMQVPNSPRQFGRRRSDVR